jgi:hypothetical protein
MLGVGWAESPCAVAVRISGGYGDSERRGIEKDLVDEPVCAVMLVTPKVR